MFLFFIRVRIIIPIVSTTVTPIPPSGPNAPPDQRTPLVSFDMKIVSPIFIPLTLQPNTFPCAKFHTVWIAEMPHIFQRRRKYKAANTPKRKRFIIAIKLIPGFEICIAAKRAELTKTPIGTLLLAEPDIKK